MKKSLIKSFTRSFLTLSLIALFSVSCSSDDDKPTETTEVKTPEVKTPETKVSTIAFTSLEASKTNIFIEETVTLNLKGTGYTETNVTSSNSKIKITKVATSVYEISSTEATTAKIYAELKNSTDNEVKSIDLNFIEHGVKNSNTVEGIIVNTDSSSKVLSILGEPDMKSDSSDGLSEYWKYASKGLSIAIVKKSSIVTQIDMMSSGFSFTNKESVKVNYTTYPSEIGNGWKINTTTMDAVIDQLGAPTKKSTSVSSPTIRTYEYSTQK